MSRKILEGREFSTCVCGNIKSAHAKQCRECYRKNGAKESGLSSSPNAAAQCEKGLLRKQWPQQKPGLEADILAELPCKPTELLKRLTCGRYSEGEVKDRLSNLLSPEVGKIELTSDRTLIFKPEPAAQLVQRTQEEQK